MEKILLLGPKSYTTRRIIEELEKKSCHVELKDWSEIVLPFSDEIPAVCLPRMTPRVSTIFQLDCIEYLVTQGCSMVNHLEAILKCDKLSQFMIWSASKKLRNLSTIPLSMGTIDVDQALNFIHKLGQVVFKPLDRGLGEGVQFISKNDPNLKMTLTDILDNYGSLFLQEYIPQQDFDLRTLAIGPDIIFQYFRRATTDFRTNISCGGIPVSIQVMKQEIPEINTFLELSRQIAEVVMMETGLEIVGVDTALNQQEIVLWEWNPFPGIEGAETIFGSNVGRKIAEYLKNKAYSINYEECTYGS
ncbi:MAG: RimK family alpha-L-glutamate ligase [Promethearchaeota archaeon]